MASFRLSPDHTVKYTEIKYAVPRGIETYGRCIGHGGMPVERGLEPDIEECPLLAWDNRRYENGEPIDATLATMVAQIFLLTGLPCISSIEI